MYAAIEIDNTLLNVMVLAVSAFSHRQLHILFVQHEQRTLPETASTTAYLPSTLRPSNVRKKAI